MKEVQLELNFAALDPDQIEPWRKEQLEKLIKYHSNSSNDIFIYSTFPKLFLGKRTFCNEVDHTMFEEISFKEAVWLNSYCKIPARDKTIFNNKG